MRKFSTFQRRIRVAFAFATVMAIASASCSQASDSEPQADAEPEGGASNESAGAGPASGSSNAAHGGNASGGLPDLAVSMGGDPSGEGGASAVCNAQVREGQRVPLDMYFLVDSSGSMDEAVSGGSKWDVVSTALTGFLEDPRSAGTGVGIGYFPVGAVSCTKGQPGCFCIPIVNLCIATGGGSCDVSDYSVPAVRLALPAQTASVVSDLAAHEVGGGTPTRPALEGALEYLGQWASQHPERKPLLILATDGEPVGCEQNTARDVAAVAARALAGPNAIRTFVIGVGSSLVSLNLVAQAGGTEHAFLVDTGGDVAKEFADALDQIRGASASCDFIIPDASSGADPLDPSKVNVSYIRNGTSSPTRVLQTAMGDPDNCGSNGGWYYDDPSSPTKIKLCETTCQSLSSGTIQVEFGCDTVEQPPR